MTDKILLFPYWLTLKIRHAMYDHGFILKEHKSEVPTVCIGNITAGGTGKTPHAEMVIKVLRESEEWAYKHVAVLSRGYKRRSRGFQQVPLDGTALVFGDEPLQIKKKFPGATVAVDRSRVEGCTLLCHPDALKLKKYSRCRDKDFPPSEIIVLDDAFQHRSLKADVNIVLVDWNRPHFNDHLIPLGRLRDLPERLRAADIVIVTKCPRYLNEWERSSFLSALGLRQGQEAFFTYIDYLPMRSVFDDGESRYIYSKNLILFSGIAKDLPLRSFLSDNYKVVKRYGYSDHHRYTPSDMREIRSAVRAWPTAVVVTTEKDAQRVRDCKKVPPEIRERLFEVPVKVEFLTDEERKRFSSCLLSKLRRS